MRCCKVNESKPELVGVVAADKIGGHMHLPENVKTTDAIQLKSAAKAVLVGIEFISLDNYMYTRSSVNIK